MMVWSRRRPLALRVDWLPGLALTAAGLLTVLLARR